MVSYGLQGYVILLNINVGQILAFILPATLITFVFRRMVESICYGEERVNPNGQDALA